MGRGFLRSTRLEAWSFGVILAASMLHHASCLEAYRVPFCDNPSISLINTPTFKEIFLAGSPPEDYFSIRVDFVWDKPPTFKGIFLGGFKNLSAGFLFCLQRCKATAPQGSAAYCF